MIDNDLENSNIEKNAQKNTDLIKKMQQDEGDRLRNQIQSYKNSKNSMDNEKTLSTNQKSNSTNRISRNGKNNPTNKLATAGLSAVGVPKGISEKVVNSKMGQKAIEKLKSKNPLLSTIDKLFNHSNSKQAEDEMEDGIQTFKISSKFKSIILISSPFALMIVVFCVLFIAASQIYLNATTLGQADSISDSDAEAKIEKSKDDDNKKDEEIKDTAIIQKNNIDYYVISNSNNKFAFNKMLNANLLLNTITIKRDYNEADLLELHDFYGDLIDSNEGIDNNVKYDFFFKLYDVYTRYAEYGVALDMPLLMATLYIQSEDIANVMESNVDPNVDYSNSQTRLNIKNSGQYDYDYDWSSYILSSNNSIHDIELLAQHMVTKSENASYKVDYEKYDEFLKEFIEKKYYLTGKSILSNNSQNSSSIDSSNIQNNSNENSVINSTVTSNYARALIQLANLEYDNKQGYNDGEKYNRALGYSLKTPWCANFVTWLVSNTKINEKSIYPDIIPFKSAGAGRYIKYFNKSQSSNIKFYYNDNCKNLKGKNGSGTNYVPKPGDFIFYDWDAKYYDISSNTQDHVAIVEKYENNIIHTIEGNMGNKIGKFKYKITDCRVIGFGSWY